MEGCEIEDALDVKEEKAVKGKENSYTISKEKFDDSCR